MPAIPNQRPSINDYQSPKVCKAFFHRKENYFTRCYNLLDDVLSEILSEETEFAQRRNTALNFFTGNSDTDKDKMEELFLKYKCEDMRERRGCTAGPLQQSDRTTLHMGEKEWILKEEET